MPHAIKLNPLFSSEKERNKHMYVIAFEDRFTVAWVAGSQEGACRSWSVDKTDVAIVGPYLNNRICGSGSWTS